MSGDPTNIAATPHAERPPKPPRDNLALVYQEILTVITRLRKNRKAVMNAAAFRKSMKAALAAADADATGKGYTPESVRLATYAVVAFLDESVENAHQPNFADWSRLPMGQELFGEPTSGEVYIECIDRLLVRPDSPENADVLEIFALCLLLGYEGRCSTGEQEDVGPIAIMVAEKVQRIRGLARLAPDWEPLPDAVLELPPDPWVRPLILGALGAVVLAALFFVGFKFALLSGASGLHAISLLAPH